MARKHRLQYSHVCCSLPANLVAERKRPLLICLAPVLTDCERRRRQCFILRCDCVIFHAGIMQWQWHKSLALDTCIVSGYVYVSGYSCFSWIKLMTRGTWWRLGWDDDFQPECRGFDSHSSRHVGTLGKSFTCSCMPVHFGVKLRYSIRAVVGSVSE